MRQSKREWLIACLLLLLLSSCGSMLFADENHSQEIEEYLNLIAIAEAQEWKEVVKELNQRFPQIMVESSVRKTLNHLKVEILDSHDVRLIRLFNRAVRNHDALSLEKAEPVTSYYKHYEAPPFFIPDIHLTFDVRESQVQVKTHLLVKRNSQESALILDGKEHKVLSVAS